MSIRPQTLNPFCQYRHPKDGRPWCVHICVTTRCNLRCRMCASYESDMVLGPKKEVLGFFKRLADWLPEGRMIFLTGGEPLMHPNILSFVETLARGGFNVAINTNGALLSAPRVMELVDAGLAVINLSLDGDSKFHDAQRNGPGLFQGAMDILHFISTQTALVLSVVSVISAPAAKHLPALVEKLSRLPRFNGVQFQAVVPTLGRMWDKNFFTTSEFWPRSKADLHELEKSLDELERLRDDGMPINNPRSQFTMWRKYFQDPETFFARQQCTVGNNNLLVQADGNLVLCSHHGNLGTIDDNPETVWNSDRAALMREKMSRCAKPCNFFVNCCYLEDA